MFSASRKASENNVKSVRNRIKKTLLRGQVADGEGPDVEPFSCGDL